MELNEVIRIGGLHTIFIGEGRREKGSYRKTNDFYER